MKKKKWEHEPTIRISELAILFNCSQARLRKMLKSGRIEGIRTYSNMGDKRFHLLDSIKAAYPEAGDLAQHHIAVEFTWKLSMRRREMSAASRGKRRDEEARSIQGKEAEEEV